MMWRTQTGGSECLGPLSGQNLHFLRGLSISDRPSLVCSEQLHTRPGQTKRVSKHIEDQRPSGSSCSLAAFSIRTKVSAITPTGWWLWYETMGHQGTGVQSGLRPYPAVPKEQLGFPILKKKNYLKRNSTNTNLKIPAPMVRAGAAFEAFGAEMNHSRSVTVWG